VLRALPLVDQRIAARRLRPGTSTVSAAHLMGGCAMGRDARDSVTDALGRVHGAPWLRVADSSLFPDALRIHPYLTIMALADPRRGTYSRGRSSAGFSLRVENTTFADDGPASGSFRRVFLSKWYPSI
jgi:hypothetical protein